MKNLNLKLIPLLFGIAGMPLAAYCQTGAGGGEVKEIPYIQKQELLRDWITKGGGLQLKLPAGVTYEDYVTKMLAFLPPQPPQKPGEIVKIPPVAVNFTDALVKMDDGSPKTCKSWKDENPSLPAHTLCNIGSYKSYTEVERLQETHHETAVLAGLEFGEGSFSDYPITRQLSLVPTGEIIYKVVVTDPNTQPSLEPIRLHYQCGYGWGKKYLEKTKTRIQSTNFDLLIAENEKGGFDIENKGTLTYSRPFRGDKTVYFDNAIHESVDQATDWAPNASMQGHSLNIIIGSAETKHYKKHDSLEFEKGPKRTFGLKVDLSEVAGPLNDTFTTSSPVTSDLFWGETEGLRILNIDEIKHSTFNPNSKDLSRTSFPCDVTSEGQELNVAKRTLIEAFLLRRNCILFKHCQ